MKAGKMLQGLAVEIERQNAVIRHSQDITNYATDLEAAGYHSSFSGGGLSAPSKPVIFPWESRGLRMTDLIPCRCKSS